MSIKSQIHDAFYRTNDIGDLDSLDEIIERIEGLLRRAMLSTDDESLHDEIRKEISYDSD